MKYKCIEIQKPVSAKKFLDEILTSKLFGLAGFTKLTAI